MDKLAVDDDFEMARDTLGCLQSLKFSNMRIPIISHNTVPNSNIAAVRGFTVKFVLFYLQI